MLDEMRPRNQRESAARVLDRMPSSNPSACWGSPAGMTKLMTLINKTVDQQTKEVLKRLSDDFKRSSAEATPKKLAKQQATEALRHG